MQGGDASVVGGGTGGESWQDEGNVRKFYETDHFSRGGLHLKIVRSGRLFGDNTCLKGRRKNMGSKGEGEYSVV